MKLRQEQLTKDLKEQIAFSMMLEALTLKCMQKESEKIRNWSISLDKEKSFDHE